MQKQNEILGITNYKLNIKNKIIKILMKSKGLCYLLLKLTIKSLASWLLMNDLVINESNE